MGKLQPLRQKTGTKEGEESAISGDSTRSRPREVLPLGASPSSSATTTATTLPASRETSARQERLDLVAGALADLQRAGILVAVSSVTGQMADGTDRRGVKLYIWAHDCNLVATHTQDGIALRVST